MGVVVAFVIGALLILALRLFGSLIWVAVKWLVLGIYWVVAALVIAIATAVTWVLGRLFRAGRSRTSA